MGKSSIDAAGAAKKSNKPKCECAREQRVFVSARDGFFFYFARSVVGFLSLSLFLSLGKNWSKLCALLM
jgi:hypothetical protein